MGANIPDTSLGAVEGSIIPGDTTTQHEELRTMTPVPNYVKDHRLWPGSLLQLAETAHLEGQEDRVRLKINDLDRCDDLTNSEKSLRIALIDWTNEDNSP